MTKQEIKEMRRLRRKIESFKATRKEILRALDLEFEARRQAQEKHAAGKSLSR